MPRRRPIVQVDPLSLRALRLSILAAAGLGGAAACSSATETAETGGGGGGGGSSSTTSTTTADGVVGSTATSSSSGPAASACKNPVPIENGDGSDTGFVRCADGSVDRDQAKSCDP